MSSPDVSATPIEGHQQLRISEEYSRIFPINPEEDLALEDSIRTYGQRDRIVVNSEYIVLDGHRRFRVCKKLGIDPRFEVRTFPGKLEETRFVLLANIQRRQLTPFQKAEAGLVLLDIESEAAHERLRTSRGSSKKDTEVEADARLAPIGARQIPDSEKGKAADIVAKEIGLKPKTFGRALTILRSNVGEEILQKLRTGELTIYAVSERLKPADAEGDNKSSAVTGSSEAARHRSIKVKNTKVQPATKESAGSSRINHGSTEDTPDTITATKICIGCRKQEASAGTDLCVECLILIRMLRGVESTKLPLGKMTLAVSASSL
jgi:ParB-like chromosome segregation protein Spo0J